MRGSGALGGIVAVVVLACAGCAAAPPVPAPAAPVVRSIAIEGAPAPGDLEDALAALAGRPLDAGLRQEAERIALDYYEWLEWREVRADAGDALDPSGRLPLRVAGTPPDDAELAPQAYFEILMPYGASRASDVPAPVEGSGARVEALLDKSFGFWLESPARVLIDAGERRLYLKRATDIVSYAVAVGTARTPTPAGEYWVEGMRHKPTWYPPASIRREYAAKGKVLGKVVPPGRGNPLGDWFVRLQNSIGIHGTNQPRSIGSAASHGCIRMHDADVAELVEALRKGDRITIVRARPRPEPAIAAGGGAGSKGAR